MKGYAKTNSQILQEVEPELYRFIQKFNLAVKEQSGAGNYSSKHYASAKRAALDLKNELTKLTQDSKYRYNQDATTDKQ